MLKLVRVVGPDNVHGVVNADKIIYIDQATDQKRNVIVGFSQIVTEGQLGIRVKGSPVEVGESIMVQCAILERKLKEQSQLAGDLDVV